MDTVQRVTVLPHEPIAEINPLLHGHFAEHLGELVTPGVWVGPESRVPNTGGIRDDVVEALRPLGIPVLRWPGGCFADDYHWRDGIGPPEARPRRLNRVWGLAEEPNQFGTHEFMALCRAIGAEPYLAGNVGSGSPAELRGWLEYCNHAGASSLADERRANGAGEPFGVRFWGVGNENWGCGGYMSPERYAEEFARFRTYLADYSGTRVFAIACGPDNADWAWTRRFLEQTQAVSSRHWDRLKSVQGLAAHYYCGTAGTATEFTDDEWLELLARARAIEGVIRGHRSILDEHDPDRRIALVFDEWGTWHSVEAGKPAHGLYQQNTMRDACVAALTLDVFHNHADQVLMANLAQLVNVLQALLLADEDGRLVRTPTYYAFDLHRPHKGATAVRLVTQAEAVTDGGASAHWCRTRYLERSAPFALRAVHGSASVRDRTLCATLVNTHPTEPLEVELDLHRARLEAAEVVTLAAEDLRAHNTFERPDAVSLSAPAPARLDGGRAVVPMPPGSVARLLGRLA